MLLTDFEYEIYKLFKRLSVCCITFGRRDSGKTDFNLLVAEKINELRLIKHFASNIKIYSSPFQIEYITNLDDLISWCKALNGRKLFIFDEVGKSLRRRTPMSKLNIEILDNLQILRKYKLSILFITPAEKYVDNASLGSDILDAIFIKPNPKNRKVVLCLNLMDDEKTWFNDIPPTSIKFDTWDIAPFKKSGSLKTPKFKEKDLEILWKWSHGETYKDLGVHRMQIHRLTTKFIKEVMERDSNKSQEKELEVSLSEKLVTESR